MELEQNRDRRRSLRSVAGVVSALGFMAIVFGLIVAVSVLVRLGEDADTHGFAEHAATVAAADWPVLQFFGAILVAAGMITLATLTGPLIGSRLLRRPRR